MILNCRVYYSLSACIPKSSTSLTELFKGHVGVFICVYIYLLQRGEGGERDTS